MKPGLATSGVVTAVLVMAGAAAGLDAVKAYWDLYTKKEEIYPADRRLVNSIPTQTASWVRVGMDQLEEAETLAVLGTQNYVTRGYVERTPRNREKPIRLSFHMTYYTGGIDAVPHVPDRCFVGGGMQIGEIVGNLPLAMSREWWSLNEFVPEDRRGQVWSCRITNEYSASNGRTVNLPFNPQDIRLRTMKFLHDGDRAVYSGYFFIANGGAVSMPEEVRLLAFDLKSRYAYYMKVQVTSGDVSSGEELAAAAGSLIGELFGDIMLCVPDWVEVEAGRYPPKATGEGGQ
ncbi:MAG: hypothetical protein HBSAPP03_10450 [Phycisphaerae bacterium]|nr:MAG: hypothetical protein HBSAPP03_10450 [Phycisphaerae bacterium]